ncbi:prophage tail fiber N-terminal domain-containing protein [Serratia sp. L9]|uniref:phage tail fiber protein n=1 Tax=Serratia sp. L9 TaxID=3423946 RepID=UPI003D66C217
MAVISGVLKGPIGDARVGVVIELRAVRTSTTVVIQARSQAITDATGRYSLSVEPGQYDVMITASGRTPERVGGIQVMLNSQPGTLNDFLTIPGEADLNPAIVETVDRMRAEAAASAASAKESENNSVAAMTNALSKVTTAEQTVASPVKFNNGTTSLGDSVLQSKTPGANVIIRFKDNDAVEQGALYNTVATGQMTLRWAGTAYSALFKPDGTVTFPSTVYSGTARLLSEATQLGTQDLNTVVDEKRYFQNSTTNATLARNYPVALAGVLEVINSHAQASGRTGVTQNYYVWNVVGYYYTRTYFALTDTWSEWDIYEARTKSDARYLQIGAYGLGADFRPSLTGYTLASDYRINGAFYANISAMTDTFDAANNHVLNVFGYSNRTYGFQIAFPFGADKMAFRRIQNNASGAWKEVWHNGNTTVDANGFLKKASPIVKLFSDGTSELNEQSQGVSTERIEEGVYRVSGTLGFNSDAGWGGADGGIEIPIDRNKLPLVWVDYEVEATGDLLIKTYHRVNSTAPKFAQNVKVGYKEGTPIDIPDGRWIDLRVEMPAGDDPVEEPAIDEPVEPEQQTEDEFKPEPEDVGNGEEPSQGETIVPAEEPKE